MIVPTNIVQPQFLPQQPTQTDNFLARLLALAQLGEAGMKAYQSYKALPNSNRVDYKTMEMISKLPTDLQLASARYYNLPDWYIKTIESRRGRNLADQTEQKAYETVNPPEEGGSLYSPYATMENVLKTSGQMDYESSINNPLFNNYSFGFE